MKYLFLTFLLITTATSHAGIQDDRFTKEQRKEVLHSIDILCGDSWCEGEFNYYFSSFDCKKSDFICELKFQIIKTDDKNKKTFSAMQSCRFGNIKTFKRLMEDQYSLNERFLEELSDCITTREYAVKF